MPSRKHVPGSIRVPRVPIRRPRRIRERPKNSEQHALDMGEIDMGHGPDEDSDDELDKDAVWTTKAQIWAWQRKRATCRFANRR